MQSGMYPWHQLKFRNTLQAYLLTEYDRTALSAKLQECVNRAKDWYMMFKVQSWAVELQGSRFQEKFDYARRCVVYAPWLELGVDERA